MDGGDFFVNRPSLPYMCHCEAVYAEAISHFLGNRFSKKDRRNAKSKDDAS